MHNFTYVRIALVGTLLAAVTISLGAIPPATQSGHDASIQLEHFENTVPEPESSPDSLASTSTYFLVRQDLRRCAFPRCGGYFVRRVNQPVTRCQNGTWAQQCYVSEIDWNGQVEVDARKALLRGSLARSTNAPNFGALRVTESWQAASNNTPTGFFYRVKDRGIRCITHPCLTHHAAMLNSTSQREIAGVDFGNVGSNEQVTANAGTAMAQPDGVVVAGRPVVVRGPAGRAYSLRASQFYLRADKQVVEQPDKPPSKAGCKRTGCSGQVCSDEDVMTTCEYRPEYACYRRARCERQTNGKCGWTQTPELSACLRNPPR